MKLTNFFIPVCCLILIGLAGCARYKSMPLSALRNRATQAGTISFAYRIFDEDDCKTYLDRDIIAKGYQPIQITITNNTNRYFTISTENFSLPTASAREVAQANHTNTKGRCIGYGVAGWFAMPILFIPALVDGLGSAKANEKLDADFARKALRPNQRIAPGRTINGLLFVDCNDIENDCDAEFSLLVTDQETNQQFTLSTSNPKLNIERL